MSDNDPNYYRNRPTATFDAHLFEAESVEDADGVGQESARAVASLCSRTTSYGPFSPVLAGDERLLDLPGADEIDLDMCDVCRSVAFGNGGEGE